MEWFQIFSSDIGSADFVLSTEPQRGTWISLLSFCCAQENGGRIAGAKQWPNDAWPKMCRVNAKNVHRESTLWQWDGEDLVVKFYPEATVAKMLQARAAGKLGGLRSGEVRKVASSKTEAETKGRLDSASTKTEAELNLRLDSASTEERRGEERREEKKREEGDASPSASASKPSKAKSERSKAPSDCPPEIAGRMILVAALLHRRSSTPWKLEELEAFRGQRLDICPDEEFASDMQALEAYYGLELAPEQDFRRRELVTLLRNWPDDVNKARTRAREWRAKHDPDGLGQAS